MINRKYDKQCLTYTVRFKSIVLSIHILSTHNLMFVNIFLTPPLRQQWTAFAIPPSPPPAADIICKQPLKTIWFHYVLGWKKMGVSILQRCIGNFRSRERNTCELQYFLTQPIIATYSWTSHQPETAMSMMKTMLIVLIAIILLIATKIGFCQCRFVTHLVCVIFSEQINQTPPLSFVKLIFIQPY